MGQGGPTHRLHHLARRATVKHMAGVDIPGAGRMSGHGMPVPDRLSCPDESCTLTVSVVGQGTVGNEQGDIYECARHHGPFFRDGVGMFRPWTDPDADPD